MEEKQLNGQAKKNPRVSLNLGKRRTVMAADRTLLAWVRTALSFISFGFTMVKLLQSVADSMSLKLLAAEGGHVGIFLLVVGTLPLTVGMYHFYRTVRDLGGTARDALLSPTFGLAFVVLLLGIVLFINIVFNWQVL